MAQSSFQLAFGGFVNEDPYAIIGTWDNGMVIGGSTSSFVSTGAFDDLYLTKLDRNGQQVWSRHYGLGLVSYALGLDTMADHGVVAVGSNNSQQGLVLKVDQNGGPAWRNTAAINRFTGVDVTAGDTIFVVGYTTGSNKDIQVGKLTGSGQPLWSFRYGTPYSDLGHSVRATSDGGAIVAGSTLVGGPNADGLLIKLNSAGSVEWTGTYGLLDYCDEFKDVCNVSNGGFLAVGSGCYSDSWPLVVRVDAQGDTLWTRRFGQYGGHCERVQEVNGGFLISGGFDGGYGTPFLMKLDASGATVWQMQLNGLDLMSFYSTHTVLADSSIAIVSSGFTDGIGARDPLVTVLSPIDLQGVCGMDSSSLQPIATTWQIGTINPTMVIAGLTASIPQSDPAATLYESVCGQVGVPRQEFGATTVHYNPMRGLLVVGDLPPGHSIAVHDVLGRRLAFWSVSGRSVELPLHAAPSTVLVTIIDGTGAFVGSHKVVIVH